MTTSSTQPTVEQMSNVYGRAVALAGFCCALAAVCPVRAQVSGVVVNDADGAPIAGAFVTVQASTVRVSTDASGAFTLPGAGSRILVAAADGWFNAGAAVTAPATGVELRLQAVPMEDDSGHTFATPSECGGCHVQQLTDWLGSAMRHAGTNTWVHDVYDGSGTAGGAGGFVYVRDSVHAATNAASECASCHQPLSWIPAPFTALVPVSAATPEVDDGVSCVVCHQLADIDLTRPNAPGIFPGVVRMTRLTDSNAAVTYGLLGDVSFQSPGIMRAAYNPRLSADVCASCHQDANDPDGDHDYDEASSVISEPTYLEWRASPYADPGAPEYATCVDCHMARNTATLACSLPLGYARAPGQLRSHRIEGTTPRFLENAVTLTLQSRREGEEIVVDVSITNDQTGHHVPTGVTIRNMILLVEAERTADSTPLAHGDEQVVHALGGVGDPADGYYAGLAGKLYANLNEGADGASPVFFTEATGVALDNRIAPLATDVTHYRFTAPGDGEVRVRARLIYRRSWRALIDAKGWTQDGHGVAVADLEAPHFGHLMEDASNLVAARGAPDGGVLDAGPNVDAAAVVDAATAVDAGGDAGTRPGTLGGGGCGCRVVAPAPGPRLWPLSLLVGALLLRRRGVPRVRRPRR